jgi:acetylornithine deacetylase/succinyl-diaminopimelate desuccinylase-like protein
MPTDPQILARIDAYIDDHLEDRLADLGRLCAIPSVAAQGAGIEPCANAVTDLLRERGFSTELIPTAGNPVVYGEAAGRSNRTLICYNHYDVQPAEPLDLWTSPPFEMARREGKLYARGVADDKGEIIGRLAAIDAVKAVLGELPCRVKFCIEGEEEIASPSLAGFIEQNAKRLAGDACIWEFGAVDNEGTPVEYLGLRGICYVELEVESLTLDAHSGLGGSIFPNAAWRLVWALNSIKGPDGRVRIPGFYDNVVEPTDRDMELLARLPDNDDELRRIYGVKDFLYGLTGVELRREEIFVPTCTICGLTSGYQGAGSKTVLPAKASVKVDFRLVLNQTPEEVLEKLRAHLDIEGFGDVKVTKLGGGRPGRTDPDDPFIQLVVRSAEEVYGRPPQIWPMTGGSGPNELFTRHLGVPIATLGGGYPGSRAHAPDENLVIEHFIRGAKHMAHVLVGFGES